MPKKEKSKSKPTSKATSKAYEDFLESMGVKTNASKASRSKDKPKLRVIALGGLGEIGKNITVIEYENDKDLNYAEIEEALSGKEILIEKKSKRQMKEINLSDHIFESKIEKKDEKSFTLYVTVSAGNTFNIKPQLLTDGLKSVCPSFNPVLALPNRKKFIFEGE